MTEPVPPRRTPGIPLAAGVALVVLALAALAMAGLFAGSQRHAYDSGAVPPSTYHLTAGHSYQLSSSGGVKDLTNRSVIGKGIVLSCLATADDGRQDQLSVDSTSDDVRDLHVFARFDAPRTGDFRISCEGVPQVFVDDADGSPTDWSALLVVVAAGLGLVGAAACLSGLYRLSDHRSEPDAAAAATLN